MSNTTLRGYTTREIAARYRVSEDRVRAWIARGELRGVNRRDTRAGRPSWVIPPDALVEFERGRSVVVLPKSTKRKKKTVEVDFYPD